jgi:large subunit ribosomal protein L5
MKNMRDIRIEKVVLSIGGVGDVLDRGVKLLEGMSGRKVMRRESRKRIPTLGVKPGLEVGCFVTLRGKQAEEMLKRLLAAIDNKLRRKQMSENSFSFGIKEYIEIPGMAYQRDVGIMGLDISVAFTRAGKRVVIRKIKRGRLPRKQNIPEEEIIDFMQNKFDTIME